jgi:hypothetical protein
MARRTSQNSHHGLHRIILALTSLFGAIGLAAFGYSLRHNPRRRLAVVVMCLGIFLPFASAGQFLLGQLNLSRTLNDLRGHAIGYLG